MNKLHKIQEWEANNPGYTFEHVFYTEKSNEVRKITGTVTVLKRKLVNGVKMNIPVKRKVRWDGYGRCYFPVQPISGEGIMIYTSKCNFPNGDKGFSLSNSRQYYDRQC